MQVTYDGPIDEVQIAETGQVAKRGEPVEVEDELGKRLLEQDTWKRAGAARTASSKDKGKDGEDR